MSTLDIVAITASVVLVVFVIEAIRRYSLNARYAILWLGAGGVLLVFSLYRPLLDWVAKLLGISYPPSLLFGLAFLFLLVIVLHYSLVISSHRESIRRLTQTVALLERALDDRRQR
jgi:hypothetical protein